MLPLREWTMDLALTLVIAAIVGSFCYAVILATRLYS